MPPAQRPKPDHDAGKGVTGDKPTAMPHDLLTARWARNKCGISKSPRKTGTVQPAPPSTTDDKPSPTSPADDAPELRAPPPAPASPVEVSPGASQPTKAPPSASPGNVSEPTIVPSVSAEIAQFEDLLSQLQAVQTRAQRQAHERWLDAKRLFEEAKIAHEEAHALQMAVTNLMVRSNALYEGMRQANDESTQSKIARIKGVLSTFERTILQPPPTGT